MVAFFLLGAASFLAAGMGLGGGVLLIPMLTRFFSFSVGQARYATLLAYLPASLASSFRVLKNEKTRAKIASLWPIGMAGSVVGTVCAHVLDARALYRSFGVLMIVSGARMLIGTVKFPNISKIRGFGAQK